MRLDPFIETTREEQHEKQHGLDTITKTGLVVATTDTAATFISCAPLVRLNVNQGRQSGTAPCSCSFELSRSAMYTTYPRTSLQPCSAKKIPHQISHHPSGDDPAQTKSHRQFAAAQAIEADCKERHTLRVALNIDQGQHSHLDDLPRTAIIFSHHVSSSS